MRYWQMTTSRLSKAANKLTMDEQWHPFQSAPLSWYRVWKKKLIQRVTFDSPEEEQAYLNKVQAVEPLPELASVSGFREELQLRSKDDSLSAVVPLGYTPQLIEELSASLAKRGIGILPEGNLLYAELPVPEMTRETLIAAQSQITAVRLFFQSVAMSSDLQTFRAAEQGFDRMIEALEEDGNRMSGRGDQ